MMRAAKESVLMRQSYHEMSLKIIMKIHGKVFGRADVSHSPPTEKVFCFLSEESSDAPQESSDAPQ